MCIYNDIIFAPFLRRRGILQPKLDELRPLVTDDSEYGE